MVHSLTNPLQHHLVEGAHHSPGVSSLRAQLSDKPVRVRRPHWYFDKDGKMPLYIELRYRIPGFEHLSHGEWAEKIRAAIAAEEEKAAEERRKTRILLLMACKWRRARPPRCERIRRSARPGARG